MLLNNSGIIQVDSLEAFFGLLLTELLLPLEMLLTCRIVSSQIICH